MEYIELTITTTSEAEELISSKLWDYTEYGVAICDDNDILELINKRRNTWDYLDDNVTKNLGFNLTLVKCYLDLDKENLIPVIEKDLLDMKEMSKEYLNFGTLEITKRIVDGDDWIEIWRKHYKPMEMDKVVICPEWIDYEQKDKPVIKIDGNMAFGTGEHETTSMCIEFIGKFLSNEDRVIDVGTGSGILGIVAAKLGAKDVVMTDIDEIAVRTAKHNVEINNVKDKCFVTLDNLLDKEHSVGDLIVANLTADILMFLKEGLLSHCHKGTILITSGIIREKADMVVDEYTKLGFTVKQIKAKGEWVCEVFEL